MTNLLDQFDLPLYNKGIGVVAGIDEVGRGALAGPMVIGAVILDPKEISDINNIDPLYLDITDSKLLSPKKRNMLNGFIIKRAISCAVFEVSNKDIDNFGLTVCTQNAFEKVLSKLKIKPDHVLTDKFELPHIAQQSQTNIIKGDQKSISIAAASIVAKVYRDNLMEGLDQQTKYAKYFFSKHKGYGTKLHIEMIKEHGYSDIHRMSYKIKV